MGGAKNSPENRKILAESIGHFRRKSDVFSIFGGGNPPPPLIGKPGVNAFLIDDPKDFGDLHFDELHIDYLYFGDVHIGDLSFR